MSPTTLYREGTDLDDLLAELDSRYPGQVRVVEVTHPREGGVLGFFAKQRVGVHYRLVDDSASAATDSAYDAVLDARSRRPVPERVAAAALGGGPFQLPGYDAARVAGSDGPLRSAALRDGFGPDPAAIRAALAHRAADAADRETVASEGADSAPFEPLPQASAVSSSHAGRAADRAAAPAPGRGLQFEQLLADIALKKAASGFAAPADSWHPSEVARRGAGARPEAAGARPEAAGARPETAATRAATGAFATSTAGESSGPVLPPAGTDAAAANSAAATFAAIDFASLASFAVTPAADRAGVPADAAAASTLANRHAGTAAHANVSAAAPGLAAPGSAASPTAPAGPTITLRRRRERAVHEVAPQVPAEVSTGAAAAMPTGVAPGAAAAIPAADLPTGPTANPATRPAADAATRPVLEPMTSTARTTPPEVALAFTSLPRIESGALPAQIEESDAPESAHYSGIPAQRGGSGTSAAEARDNFGPIPAQNQMRPGALDWPLAAGGALRFGGSTALLDRPTAAPSAQVPQAAAPANTANTMPEPASMRTASYQGADGSATMAHPTPLTLRRQLLEVGVPVDRVPTTAVHSYAAVEALVRGLDPAPALTSRPGQILVLAGPARDVMAAVESVLVANPGVFESTWAYGCPAPLGTRRASRSVRAIGSADEAAEVAKAARADTEGPTLVAVATDTAPTDTAIEVLSVIGADAVWAAVDATRKPADTRRMLHALAEPDAIVVTNAEFSASPATVWELGLPIALVDGRPSTGPSWAVLLLGKLAELEETECSDAPC